MTRLLGHGLAHPKQDKPDDHRRDGWQERETIGDLDDQLATSQAAEKIAEHYLSVMHARQLRYEAKALAAEATAAEAKKTEKLWTQIA